MKKVNSLVAALLLGALAASGALAAEPSKVLATVGGEKITQADLDAAMMGMDPQQKAMYATEQGQANLIQALVDFKLFALLGREMKIQDTAQYKNAMASYETVMLSRGAMEKVLKDSKSAVVSDAEAQKFYDEHKEIFVVPAAVKASHILIEVAKNASDKDVKAAKQKAAAILKDIKAGKISFEDAAKQHSSCPSKNRGGDLGFFAKGQMVKPFEEAAFALKKDQMSKEPVRTDFGFHIIKVTDSRNAVTRPFSDTKEDIKNQLVGQKQMEVLERTKSDLRKRFPVKLMNDKVEAIKPQGK